MGRSAHPGLGVLATHPPACELICRAAPHALRPATVSPRCWAHRVRAPLNSQPRGHSCPRWMGIRAHGARRAGQAGSCRGQAFSPSFCELQSRSERAQCAARPGWTRRPTALGARGGGCSARPVCSAGMARPAAAEAGRDRPRCPTASRGCDPSSPPRTSTEKSHLRRGRQRPVSDTELMLVLAILPLVALVAGSGLLVLALRSDSAEAHRYEGGGRGGNHPRNSPRPFAGSPSAPPLPHATSARVRLRQPGRLADLLPQPPRRQPGERQRRAPTFADRS
jgi:hypothetical protein